jgi:hypothetical protein
MEFCAVIRALCCTEEIYFATSLTEIVERYGSRKWRKGLFLLSSLGHPVQDYELYVSM